MPSSQVEGKPSLIFAAAYEFRNIQNLMQKIKRGRCPYHFVEVMVCSSGQSRGRSCVGVAEIVIGGRRGNSTGNVKIRNISNISMFYIPIELLP